ncbi:MAG TPA: aldo/keto reductase [Thermoplasmata archaeon]|nr:aldo/keto reductase [Thermoplasmata archaeon]
MPGIPGHATPEGTGRFATASVVQRKIPSGHFRRGPGGLSYSSFGLGTYLGDPDSATDALVEEAAAVCLTSGRVNVLDTAINYRFQKAERSIGRAVARVIRGGAVEREAVFVATKNGYLAPDADARIAPGEWIEEKLIRSGVLKRSDIVDGSHAMSVRFLEDQLERSRVNLGLETIDLLYLHNAPEAQIPVVGRSTFLQRLGDAFGFFEKKRRAGALRSYGLATWDSLRVPRSDPGFLSLEEAVGVARTVGGDGHGFQFVQFPFNPVMPEATALRNQSVAGERLSLFEAARRLGIGCFTSVPLLQGQLAREGEHADKLSSALTALQFARSAPGTLGPMVGQKHPEHLAENLRLAEQAPWDETAFRRWIG